MNKIKLLQTFALVVSLSVAFSTQAKMYKWVDEDGVTHYTQTPPPGDIESKTIKSSPSTKFGRKDGYVDDMAGKADEYREQRLETKKEEQRAKTEQAELQQACAKARQRVASFLRPRVDLVDEDGNVRRASEEERLKNLEEARKYVRENCN